MTRFQGKTAIVTGAGSGLGRATALATRLPKARPSPASTSRSMPRQIRRARSARPAARRAPTRSTCRIPASVRAAVAAAAARSRSSVGAGELRRDRQVRELARDAVRGLVADHRRQPHRHASSMAQAVLPLPARRRRQHRQHRLQRRPDGPAVQRRLLRLEGRRGAAHPRARRRVPAARRAGERGRAGRHLDTAAERPFRATGRCRPDVARQAALAARQRRARRGRGPGRVRRLRRGAAT